MQISGHIRVASFASAQRKHEGNWPHRDDELRALFNEGLSTGAIGRAMDISKNAVVGRLHRIGLFRASPIKRLQPGQDCARGKRRARTGEPVVLEGLVKPQVPPAKSGTCLAPAQPAAPLPAIRALRAPSFCAWPTSELTKGAAFKFCEAPVHIKQDGKRLPYCYRHCCIAYATKPEASSVAAE